MLRLILVVVSLTWFTIATAAISWVDMFHNVYHEKSIDHAVIFALQEGKSPEEIIKISITISGLNTQNIIRALYCAGADGWDIKKAAAKYGIPEATVVVGYKKNIDECTTTDAFSKTYYTGGVHTGRNGTFASSSK